MDAKALLKKTRLFHDFNQLELLKVTEIARRDFLPKGDTIINEGENFESDSSLYIISNGLVKVAVKLGDSMELVFSILGPPETFGEISFTDNMPRSANVTAMNDTELLKIDHGAMLELMEKDSQMALKFYHSMSKVLAAKLRTMNVRALEGFERYSTGS